MINYNQENTQPCELCASSQTEHTSYGILCGWCFQDLKEKAQSKTQ